MADCRYCANMDDCQYIIAPDDNLPEAMKKDFDKIEEGIFSMFRLFGKKEDE